MIILGALIILGPRPLPFTTSRETRNPEGEWNSFRRPDHILSAKRGHAQGGLCFCQGTWRQNGQAKMGGSLQEEASGGAPIATIGGLSCCCTIFLKHRGTKQHQMKSTGTHLAASAKIPLCGIAFQSSFLLRRYCCYSW